MTDVTQEIAKYVKEKGIAITVISEKTGIPYGVLHPCLSGKRKRKLRADEFLAVCNFLEIEPMKFRWEATQCSKHYPTTKQNV